MEFETLLDGMAAAQEADIAAGRVYTTDEVWEQLAETKRRWRAERGL